MSNLSREEILKEVAPRFKALNEKIRSLNLTPLEATALSYVFPELQRCFDEAYAKFIAAGYTREHMDRGFDVFL